MTLKFHQIFYGKLWPFFSIKWQETQFTGKYFIHVTKIIDVLRLFKIQNTGQHMSQKYTEINRGLHGREEVAAQNL